MKEYRELFYWWFKLGLKICLAYLLIIIFPGLISLIQEGSAGRIFQDQSIFIDVFIKILTLVTTFIGISLLFGLVAVGLKRIREDELLRFWK